MKKLTPERLAIVEPAIFQAQQAKEGMKQAPTASEAWFVAMRPYHNAHSLIMSTLGASIARVDELIAGTAVLSDFYSATGEPLKGVRA